MCRPFTLKSEFGPLADADAMVDVIERNNVAFALGANMCWHRGFNTMRNLINSGDFGGRTALSLERMALFSIAEGTPLVSSSRYPSGT